MFSMLIGMVTGVIIGMTTGWGELTANAVTGVVAIISFLLLYTFQFLYFGYYWSKHGSTIGMTLMGIQVIRQDGRRSSFLRAGLRGAVGYTVSGLVFGLGYLWALFDPNRETWHDKLFDTRVVRIVHRSVNLG